MMIERSAKDAPPPSLYRNFTDFHRLDHTSITLGTHHTGNENDDDGAHLMKRFLIGITLLSVLAVGVGAASAQERGPRERILDGLWREAIALVAEQTGLEPVVVARELRGGSTLAELITANGGDVDAFVAETAGLVTEKVNAALEEGKLTQAQADRILANLESALTEGLNRSFDGPRPVRTRIQRHVIQLAADQTGLDSAAIVEQLLAGTPLADILSENGVDPTVFVDALMAQAQERVDSRMAQMHERLTECINQAGA
jgi:hypothetical protein